MKPVIRGLIDRQGEPAKAMLPAVRGYVVKCNWADLQPVQGGPIKAGNAIDQALARVRDPQSPVHGLALKLRVFAGTQAPAWVKTLGGAAVPYIDDPQNSAASGTVGRFWLPQHVAAYADLQAKLAAKYDTAPEVREITLSAPCTFYDEPFVRQPLRQNMTALTAAGYTTQADQAAIIAAIRAHDVWKQTTTDIDFSPFPTIPGGGQDLTFTLAAIRQARSILGPRAGLQNNALSSDKLAVPAFQQMYAAMAVEGGTVVFQTAAMSRLGDMPSVMAAAVQYGAGSVELPQGYGKFGVPALTGWAKALTGS